MIDLHAIEWPVALLVVYATAIEVVFCIAILLDASRRFIRTALWTSFFGLDICLAIYFAHSLQPFCVSMCFVMAVIAGCNSYDAWRKRECRQ